MSSRTSDLVRAAVEIARTAGLVAAERFAAGTTASLKPDGTELSPADVEVERLIRTLIAERFPGDRTYGEEEGAAGGGAGRRWVIDPINGTALFIRRIPTFDMLLAVEVDDRPLVSVMHSPVTARTYFAGVGEGAWRQDGDGRPERLAVSDRDRARGARVGLLNMWTWSESLLLALHREVVLVPWVGLATGVASGLADAAVIAGHPMGYQDMAPMPVLVAEAGGRVTDLAGRDMLAGAGDVLISNGRIHDQLLDLIAGLPTEARTRPGG
jgi:histidinol-phosphatase